MSALKDMMLDGWLATRKDAPSILLPYWNYRDELSVHDGIIMKSNRVLVPSLMKEEVFWQPQPQHTRTPPTVSKKHHTIHTQVTCSPPQKDRPESGGNAVGQRYPHRGSQIICCGLSTSFAGEMLVMRNCGRKCKRKDETEEIVAAELAAESAASTQTVTQTTLERVDGGDGFVHGGDGTKETTLRRLPIKISPCEANRSAAVVVSGQCCRIG